MPDLIAQGGAAGAGTFFGAIASWFGFRHRLDAQDKRIDKLAEHVIYDDTCEAKVNGFTKRLDDHGILLAEMRGDIKELLGRKS